MTSPIGRTAQFVRYQRWNEPHSVHLRDDQDHPVHIIQSHLKPLLVIVGESQVSFERCEWRPVKGAKRARNRYARYARATFRKDRRLNIRISSEDLEAIRKRALEEGLPYQTLIASLLHQFASGRLKKA